MSDYTDSLSSEDDDDFKKLLLQGLSEAEKNHKGNETQEDAYWQGRKDAFRSMLAAYLNRPEISDLSNTSWFSRKLRRNPMFKD